VARESVEIVRIGLRRQTRVTGSGWLIAALTHEIGGLVWSLDEDFVKLERLELVERYDATDARIRSARSSA